MFFKCQVFDKDGKIIEERHVQISVGGVEDATKNEQVQKLKKKAMNMGFAFRVKREED
jgi:hypothetical protein